MKSNILITAAISAAVLAYQPIMNVCAESGILSGLSDAAATASDYTASPSDYSVSDTKYIEGTVIMLPMFERNGYEFIEWNSEKDGSGESYFAGEEYSITRDAKLFAIWNRDAEIATPSSAQRPAIYILFDNTDAETATLTDYACSSSDSDG